MWSRASELARVAARLMLSFLVSAFLFTKPGHLVMAEQNALTAQMLVREANITNGTVHGSAYGACNLQRLPELPGNHEMTSDELTQTLVNAKYFLNSSATSPKDVMYPVSDFRVDPSCQSFGLIGQRYAHIYNGSADAGCHVNFFKNGSTRVNVFVVITGTGNGWAISLPIEANKATLSSCHSDVPEECLLAKSMPCSVVDVSGISRTAFFTAPRPLSPYTYNNLQSSDACMPGSPTGVLVDGAPADYGLKATYYQLDYCTNHNLPGGVPDFTTLMPDPNTPARCQKALDYQALNSTWQAGDPPLDPVKYRGCFGATLEGYVNFFNNTNLQDYTVDHPLGFDTRFRVCLRTDASASLTLSGTTLITTNLGVNYDSALSCVEGHFPIGYMPIEIDYAGTPGSLMSVLQLFIIPVKAIYNVHGRYPQDYGYSMLCDPCMTVGVEQSGCCLPVRTCSFAVEEAYCHPPPPVPTPQGLPPAIPPVTPGVPSPASAPSNPPVTQPSGTSPSSGHAPKPGHARPPKPAHPPKPAKPAHAPKPAHPPKPAHAPRPAHAPTPASGGPSPGGPAPGVPAPGQGQSPEQASPPAPVPATTPPPGGQPSQGPGQPTPPAGQPTQAPAPSTTPPTGGEPTQPTQGPGQPTPPAGQPTQAPVPSTAPPTGGEPTQSTQGPGQPSPPTSGQPTQSPGGQPTQAPVPAPVPAYGAPTPGVLPPVPATPVPATPAPVPAPAYGGGPPTQAPTPGAVPAPAPTPSYGGGLTPGVPTPAPAPAYGGGPPTQAPTPGTVPAPAPTPAYGGGPTPGVPTPAPAPAYGGGPIQAPAPGTVPLPAPVPSYGPLAPSPSNPGAPQPAPGPVQGCNNYWHKLTALQTAILNANTGNAAQELQNLKAVVYNQNFS